MRAKVQTESAIEEVRRIIERKRITNHEGAYPSDLMLSVQLYERLFNECRESLRPVTGMDCPDKFLFLGVEVSPYSKNGMEKL